MNEMTIKLSAKSENEAVARTAVSAFLLLINPSVEELSDVKTAVSEAVTNAIVHAYPQSEGEIEINCTLGEDYIKIIVKDNGVGIESIDVALQPYFTTKPCEERSGLGFTIMRSFMDEFEVKSVKNQGTILTMLKKIA